MGRTLKTAKRVIFDLPNAIAGQNKSAREAGQATPEYRKLVAVKSVIKASSAVIFGADSDKDEILTAVTALKAGTVKAGGLKEAVKVAGQTYRDRAADLRDELRLQKEELAKDFASDVISALLQ